MKFTKERHIIFKESNLKSILIDYLKKNGEKNIPDIEDVDVSFDVYKTYENELTLMFEEEVKEPDIEDIWQAEKER